MELTVAPFQSFRYRSGPGCVPVVLRSSVVQVVKLTADGTVLRLPRLGKRELILVLFVRLFGLCLFRFFGFLFLLGSGKGCGLWLCHSLDFSLTFFAFLWVCLFYSGFLSLSTIFLLFRDGVWMWQAAQCSLLECCLTEISRPRQLTWYSTQSHYTDIELTSSES